MTVPIEIKSARSQATLDALLLVNNRSADETSPLTSERWVQLLDMASVALYVPPDAALLLAFDQSSIYDGFNFSWFKSRLDRFIYIDRVVVSERYRRTGIGKSLYAEVFKRAAALGHQRIVCEVNLFPPNVPSDQFHEALGFKEVGRAAVRGGSKVVRYLAAHV